MTLEDRWYEAPKPTLCGICRREFLSREDVDLHMAKEHPVSVLRDGSGWIVRGPHYRRLHPEGEVKAAEPVPQGKLL